MILPDVNILIYAFRKDASHHKVCRTWLNELVEGDSRFGVSPLVLAAFVRIATNHRVFGIPSALEEAFGFCADLLGQPHCQPIEPGDRHWTIFQQLCLETETRGPRVSDAWFAALAIESGCTWITMDRDFARFPGLKWRRPSV
jgi:toxin-antitoxin system PIN domain toxin